MRAKLSNMAPSMVAGSARTQLQEQKATKTWPRRAQALLSVMIAAVLIVGAWPAAAAAPGIAKDQKSTPTAEEQAAKSCPGAGKRDVKVYTSKPGGVLGGTITWCRKGQGYTGSIVGSYTDLEADNYCVIGQATGGAKWVDLGPPACPEGHSQAVNFRYGERKPVKTADVRVCMKENLGNGKGLGKLAYCSKW
jgi:hypothetical protein